MLNIEGGWKEDLGLVHDMAQEAGEAWKTVEAAGEQRRSQPQQRQKSSVAEPLSPSDNQMAGK